MTEPDLIQFVNAQAQVYGQVIGKKSCDRVKQHGWFSRNGSLNTKKTLRNLTEGGGMIKRCLSPPITIQSHEVHVVIASGAKQSRFSPSVRGTGDCFPAERGILLLEMTAGQTHPCK